ncbi:MAG TPA: 4Fe-4S binding protein [Prolixibacteraceae bacterium]|nr:4Fe-4S binding protein [Prolixibacteraceae bacterium]
MKQLLKYISLIPVLLFWAVNSFAVDAKQRFPKPEFDSGYVQPATTAPGARMFLLEYLDVIVLFVALSLVTWLLLEKRSRKGIFWVSVFSLLYFGFYREGCICSIGAIQNVVLGMVDPTYAIPLTALLFFLLPLAFALFFGRVFCGGVCPLGAIQDIVAIKPIELPKWIMKVLGLIPYLYLGLAILYVATKSEFIICRYDPFIGIFRLDAPFNMLILGTLFLAVGVFVARPYCRFFCPYGVVLSWMSRFSSRHMTITPTSCIQCKLCANSCPYGAIDEPVEETGKRRSNVNRLMAYFIVLPLWIGIGGLAGSMMHVPLSRFNQTVYLAELIVEHPEVKNDPDNIDVRTFMGSGKSTEQLVMEADGIRRQFYNGGWILGGFMGLVIGTSLIGLSAFRKREDWEPNKANCLSCARCMDYCPVKREI